MRRLIILMLLAPMPALAHGAGDHLHGLMAGITHPLSGLDHILAMVAVGLWAGLCGLRATWLLPAAFLAGMAFGGGLGMAGIDLPMVEAGILASVMVLGTLIAASLLIPLVLAVPLLALFGLLHGQAHGAELADGLGAYGYALGFLLATGALHAGGVLLARVSQSGPARIGVRIGGGAMVALVLALIGLA